MLLEQNSANAKILNNNINIQPRHLSNMPMTRATLHYLDNPDPKKLASFRTCASAMSVMAKRTSHLEAERKFTPTALLKSQLDGNYKEYVQSLRRLDGAAKSTHRPCECDQPCVSAFLEPS